MMALSDFHIQACNESDGPNITRILQGYNILCFATRNAQFAASLLRACYQNAFHFASLMQVILTTCSKSTNTVACEKFKYHTIRRLVLYGEF